MIKELSKVILGLTYRCQSRCIHCSCARHPVTPALELNIEEIKRIIRHAALINTQGVNLFGGEPTLRSDFFEILAFASTYIPSVTIDTNGYLFTKDFTQRVKQYGIDTLFVSLAGSTAEIHNSIQAANTFDRAVEAIRNTVAADINCHVSICAFKEFIEKGELERIIRFAKTLGAQAARIALPMCSGNLLFDEDSLLSFEEAARVRKIAAHDPFIYLVEEDEGSFTRCHAVSGGSIYISPYGDVQPCNFIPISFGNVREESLEIIYERMLKHSLFTEDSLQGSCPMHRPAFIKDIQTHVDEATQLWHISGPPSIFLGNSCNNRCRWCLYDERITLDADTIVEKIKSLENPYREVLFYGGEPTIDPDIIRYMNTAQSRGWTVILYTNARLFSYRQKVHEFVKAGLKGVVVPFYSLNEEEFDFGTRVENGYRQTLIGIQNLHKAGVNVSVEIPPQADAAKKDMLLKRLISLQVDRVSILKHSPREKSLRCSSGKPSGDRTAAEKLGSESSSSQLVFFSHWKRKPDFTAYDVVLIYPDHESIEMKLQLPYSLIYLATPLIAAGYKVKIIDERICPEWEHELVETLNRSPGCLCVGISCFISNQTTHAIRISSFIKNKYPDTPVVWGGYLPSTMPETTLKSKLADILVIGEGETAFHDLVNALKRKIEWRDIPGIASLDGERIIINPSSSLVSLDDLPDLAFDLIDIDRYRDYRQGIQWSVYSSRGCVYNCTFCSISKVNQRKWRSMSGQRVIREIRKLVEFGADDVAFCEDNFFVDFGRVEEIATYLINENIRITWSASCRVDAILRMKNGLIDLLYESGLRHLHIGAESGSDRILKLLNKRISRQDIVDANRKVKAHNIIPEYIFMMEFPTETDEEKECTLSLINQLKMENPDAWFWRLNKYIPYPGTPLFELALEHGFEAPSTLEQWARYGWYQDPVSDMIEYQVAF